MMRPGDQGMVLLPVVLALAFTGALAWAMVREGSMNVSEVDTAYDAQVARYLAEAGLNLGKWQNRQHGCASIVKFVSYSLPGGTITANGISKDSGGLTIDMSATTVNGQTAQIKRSSVPSFDATKRVATTWSGNTTTENDTGLVYNDTSPNGNVNRMNVTDDIERGMVQFILTSLNKPLIVSAQLSLFQTSNKSDGDGIMYVHRVTTAWNEATATWTTPGVGAKAPYPPWKTPGGDFVDMPAGSMTITKQTNTRFDIDISMLVDAWAREAVPNYGVILTSSGLKQAQFGTVEDKAHLPQLALVYYPSC